MTTMVERREWVARPAAAWLRMFGAGAIVTIGAAAMVPVGAVTLFRARRLYSRMARGISLAVLWMYGIRLEVHAKQPFAERQTVYVSNHTSTLDLFVLVALGLPNCRFFLSGFLRRIVPLGIIASMLGTFFTVPQRRPDERRRIFQRAERILRRTRESVYLSPEGGRITTGQLGPFNKGAFHLAMLLEAPIVPLLIAIPNEIDPGLGYDARAGTVRVHVLDPIDTSGWTLDRLVENKERVRELLVRAHRENQAAVLG
jgi:1-acyl-sn-glycerol-3-phosphate acyltransferase